MSTSGDTWDFVIWSLFWLTLALVVCSGIVDLVQRVKHDVGRDDIRNFPRELQGEAGPEMFGALPAAHERRREAAE